MRRDIEGQGVHTEEIVLNEIQLGDSVVFPTKGETKKEKKAFIVGWEHLANLPQEAAEIVLMRKFPNAIFNSKCQSTAGNFPSKLSEWKVGFGVAVELLLAVAGEEQVVLLVRSSKEKYELIRSRESRHSDRIR